MNDIKLLIVDDNIQIQTIMRDYYSRMEQITVVGVAGTGSEALELTKKFHPDIVILDIVMPETDGFGYLENLRKYPGEKPNVIVVSALRDNCVERAIEMGACFYIIKPFDYEMLYRRILDFGQKRPAICDPKPFSTGMPPMPESDARSVDDQISHLLLGIGIPPHVKGFNFLQQAVWMVINNRDLIKRITKELYPTIGKQFSVTPAVVERTIRHAIKTAWQRGGAQNMNELFGYHVYSAQEKPTNSEFIALIAEKITKEKRQSGSFF